MNDSSINEFYEEILEEEIDKYNEKQKPECIYAN
jgi:hypothetical protein